MSGTCGLRPDPHFQFESTAPRVPVPLEGSTEGCSQNTEISVAPVTANDIRPVLGQVSHHDDGRLPGEWQDSELRFRGRGLVGLLLLFWKKSLL